MKTQIDKFDKSEPNMFEITTIHDDGRREFKIVGLYFLLHMLSQLLEDREHGYTNRLEENNKILIKRNLELSERYERLLYIVSLWYDNNGITEAQKDLLFKDIDGALK